MREVKARQMGERFFRFLAYIGFTCINVYILRKGNFLHWNLLGEETEVRYFENYPCQRLPPHLDDFYLFKLGYHFYETLFVLLMHRNRRDFSEMFLHHIFTMALVIFSYGVNFLPIGAVIMLVMDISDIFVSFFKITVDVWEYFQNLSYVVMLLTWAFFRLYHYPVWQIYEYYLQTKSSNHPM